MTCHHGESPGWAGVGGDGAGGGMKFSQPGRQLMAQGQLLEADFAESVDALGREKMSTKKCHKQQAGAQR